MALSSNLMKAILSMDSYNRGYDAGISSLSDASATKLGNATLTINSASLEDDNGSANIDQIIGFYAQAYSYNGETVISYRGTDDLGLLPDPTDKDVFHGWSLGLGNTDSEQGLMAIDFYQSVEDSVMTDISTVGHSLGGGLAGYVGALYGQEATVFDSMDFEAAASVAYYKSTYHNLRWVRDGIIYEQEVSPDGLAALIADVEANSENTVLDSNIIDPVLREKIYGDVEPWPLNPSEIQGYFAEGEFLSNNLTPWSYQNSNNQGYDLGDSGELGAGDKHSIDSLVIRMFAETEIPAANQWENAAQYFWPVLYNDGFAGNIGFNTDVNTDDATLLGGELQGDDKYSQILRQTIAYSAIAEGDDNTVSRPFGDTAIRALYNDADQLGQVASAVQSAAQNGDAGEALSKIFINFAGQLALNQVLQSSANGTTALDGVFFEIDQENLDKVVSINLSDQYWDDNSGGQTHNISTYKQELISSLSTIPDNADIEKFYFSAGQSNFFDLTDGIFDTEGSIAIFGGEGDDYFKVDEFSEDYLHGGLGLDVLDVRDISLDLNLDRVNNNTQTDSYSLMLSNQNNGESFFAYGIDSVLLGAGNDNISLYNLEGLVALHTGDGNDTVKSSITGLAIDLGKGDDVVENAGYGSVITTGDGNDIVSVNSNLYITDASYDDRLQTLGGTILTGAIRGGSSESAWAKGNSGEYYSVNQNGDLVIRTNWSRGLFEGANEYTYVANYQSTLAGNTAGIFIGDLEVNVWQFFQEDDGTIDDVLNTWDAIGLMSKAYTGTNPITGKDPLVIDLDGDGIELLPETYVTGKYFDLNGDGFSERTGWVSGDDGLLAIDTNQNGVIDDISELFGSPDVAGFTELAALDSNSDGVIDANDTEFNNIRVWQDSNENAVTDAGELKTLAELDIVSLNVTPTSTVETDNTGHAVVATGDYTKTDSSTGVIGEVLFDNNLFDSKWNGSVTLSTEALALPEIKGHGTLTSLREAMSLDPTLVNVVNNAVASFSSPDLDGLRSAVLPILSGWMDAVSVPAGTAGLITRSDVDIITSSDVDGVNIDDFIIKRNDGGGDYYEFASGRDVLDALGDVITNPSYSDVMSQTLSAGQEWDVLDGQAIQFMERWLGVPITIGEDSLSGSASIAAVSSLIDVVWTQLNQLVVGLAAQSGGLSQFFQGVVYDPEAAQFSPVDNRELAPVLEEIFDAAPGTVQGDTDYLESWKPFIDVVVSNFDRGGAGILSGGYLFQNIVTAYENIGLSIPIEQVGNLFGIPSGLISTASGTVTYSDNEDIIYMTSGDDVIDGGKGADTYVLGENFGHDVIDNYEDTFGTDTNDIVRFAQASSTDVTAVRDGNDMIITVTATGDELRLTNQFEGRAPSLFGGYIEGSNGVSQVVFSDGVVWDRNDMAYEVLDINNASENVIGTRSADYLDGGAGDEVLHGGQDGDVYYYSVGYGNDIIDDIGTTDFVGNEGLSSNTLLDAPDILVLKDLNYNDVELSREDTSSSSLDDLIITISSTGETLKIIDQFWFSYNVPIVGDIWFNRIEGFIFANNYQIGADQLMLDMLVNAKTDGDDVIYGFDSDDTLDGGAGNDYLAGGGESDTYIFGEGYGSDVIFDNHTNAFADNLDTVLFLPDVDHSTVLFSRLDINSEDLLITLSDGSTLIIEDQFYSNFGGEVRSIENFQFQDAGNILWDKNYIKELVLLSDKTIGDDVIYGFNGSGDTLDGGAGNDILRGLNGGDTYIYGIGYGNDTVIDDGQNYAAGVDVIQFTNGLIQSDVEFSRDGDDVIVTIISTGETLRVSNQFNSFGFQRVESYEFSDVTLNYSDVITLASQGLVIEGDEFDNDPLNGTSGDDIIFGHDGNDSLYGDIGNDVLIGGAGDDTLYGGSGSDIFIFNKNDGHDYIDRQATANQSKIYFEDGILSSDITIVRTDNDKRDITFQIVDQNNSVTVEDFNRSTGSYLIGELLFSDSESWNYSDVRQVYLDQNTTIDNDTVIGFEKDDIFESSLGDDVYYGYGGDDIYKWGDGVGNDVVYESGRDNNDRVIFEGLNIDDLSVEISGDDFVFTNLSNNEQLIVKDQVHQIISNYYIENYEFDDGSVISRFDLQVNYIADQVIIDDNSGSVIRGFSGVDTIYANGGSDYIYAYSGNDIITGGEGNDKIYGGDGQDTVKYSGIFSHYTFTDNGSYWLVTDDWGNEGSDRLYDVEYAEFADGIYDVSTQIFDSFTGVIEGTAANDTLTGTVEDDVINGLAGDDIINAGEGDDVISGGAGNDTIDGGAGMDTVSYKDATSGVVVNLKNGTVSNDGEGGSDTLTNIENIIGSDFNDNLKGFNGSTVNTLVGGYGADRVYGYTGDDVIYDVTSDMSDNPDQAQDGFDIIYGNGGHDTIYHQTGNAFLSGGSGSDTYIVRFNDAGVNGNTIQIAESGAGNDTLVLSSINYADTNWGFSFGSTSVYSGFYGGIRLTYTGTSTPTVVQFNNQLGTFTSNGGVVIGIEKFEFADGTIIDFWNLPFVIEGTTLAETINGTTDDDYIVSYAGDNIVYAYAGDDFVSGGNDNDEIHGGLGNDVLSGLVGDDEIYGDAGNDNLQGGSGNDMLYGGDGDDFINGSFGDDVLYGDAGNDILKGFHGSNTLYGGTGNDHLAVGGNSSHVGTAYGEEGDDTIIGFYGDDVLYGDGDGSETYEGDDLIKAGRGDDVLYGGGGNDILEGAQGDDIIYGGGGNDQLYGERIAGGTNNWTGDDTLYGEAGNDTLYGRTGTDILIGGLGDDNLHGGDGDDILYGDEGKDLLYGDGGADMFIINEAGAFDDLDVIVGFNVGQNDRIDLSDLLSQYDAATDNITDFVEITEIASYSYIAVDIDGGADNFQQILRLNGVSGLTDEEALVTSGTLIV